MYVVSDGSSEMRQRCQDALRSGVRADTPHRGSSQIERDRMPGTARSTFILILVYSPTPRGALDILPHAAPHSTQLSRVAIDDSIKTFSNRTWRHNHLSTTQLSHLRLFQGRLGYAARCVFGPGSMVISKWPPQARTIFCRVRSS